MAEKRGQPGPTRTRRRGGAPALLAGIDVGSTAMRLHIAQHNPGAELPFRIIEELSHPLSIGADTFIHGIIRPETMRAIHEVLDNFLRLVAEYGVEHRRAVATSAVREASNREILVDRVRHHFGLDIEVLDVVEESRLAYQALLPWLRRRQGSYSLALNLGGGSTEIMVLRGEDLQTGGSRQLGTSRLFHSAGAGGTQIRRERLQALAASIVRSTREAYQDYSISHFFLINRTLYRAFRSDPAAETHERDFVMPADALRERIGEWVSRGNLEIGAAFDMGLDDVEILVPAMLILDNFIETSEVDEVTFTNTELLTGLLAEMEMDLRGENSLMSFRRQMVRSSRAVGEQYFYDRSHARAVTGFALQLFDALRDLLDLGDKDRLLLEIAAVLHDIGMFVSSHRHHLHSAYLVKWSDVVGLNEGDRVLTSQIVLFHRSEIPSERHPEFAALPLPDRLRVTKLAGILRLADVLDRDHGQNVKELRAEIDETRLILHLRIAVDLGIILDALPKKADLLEQVTGLQVVLRREMSLA